MKIVERKWALVDVGRKRIIFVLKNEEGKEAFGEISPFPLLNQESIEEAFEQLKNSDNAPFDLFPSVAFSIKNTLLAIKDPLPAFSLPMAAFFQGSVKEIYCQAEKAHQLGIKSAKLKIGSLSTSDAKEVIDALKASFYLRIDLNQKWKTKEVLRFFSSYSYEDFDYIEDPLQEIDKLSSFPLPFAIDIRPGISLSLPMKAAIVKPTIIKQIPELEKPIILSSCFDTGINVFHLACLAKRLNLTLPQGFGPYFFLKHDLLDQPLTVKNGMLLIPETIQLNKELYASMSNF